MKQGTQEWLEFRKKHIGASEVSAIIGESDFMNAHDLFLIKTGKKEAFKGNWATKRGSDAEEKIKALYEEFYNTKLTSPVLEYKDWPVLSASLDGWNEETKLVVEFKYPSAEKHEMAERGIVPETYRAQLQTQMLVSGADTAHYVSYNGQDLAVVVVKADPHKQGQILEACKSFWEHVENDVSPMEIMSETLEVIATRYKQLDRIIKTSEDEIKLLKERINELVIDDKAYFYGLSLTRSKRKGNIDYAKVPQLSGIDLESYRRPDTEITTIKVIE